MTDGPVRSRRAPLVLVGVSLVTVALGTAAVLAVRDRLPDPVAIHWGPSGADGFVSLTADLAITAATVLGVGALLGALAACLPLTGRSGIVGVGTGTCAWMGVFLYGATLQQAGLDDPAAAGLSSWLMLLATVVGLGVGLLSARAVRVPPPPLPDDLEPVPDDVKDSAGGAPGRPSTWRIPVATATWVVGGLVLVLTLPLAWTSAWAVTVPALLLIAVVMGAGGTVRVDESGLAVRALAGFPLIRVPLERIHYASTTDVHPLTDFGGWGYRIGHDGRRGLVLRNGPALRVVRHGEPDVVVTIDDPEDAAAAVNAWALRRT